MEKSHNRCLLIFVKNPELGRVKTRLAATTGDQHALGVYRELLRITADVAVNAEAFRQVWYSRSVEQNDVFSSKLFDKKVQSAGTLGDKMKKAFRSAFKERFRKVLIIGSDCPGLTSEQIHTAYEKLNSADVVIGPSADGGYYLLGMNRFIPQLFDGISWSTSAVLNQTKAVIERLGLRADLLPVLNDIDTEDDLNNSRFFS